MTLMNIPITYEQAINSDDSEKLKTIMDSEFHVLTENDTWEIPMSNSNRRQLGLYTVSPAK